jgi:hypothetical protein
MNHVLFALFCLALLVGGYFAARWAGGSGASGFAPAGFGAEPQHYVQRSWRRGVGAAQAPSDRGWRLP